MTDDNKSKEGQKEQLPTTTEEFATVDPSLIFKNINPIEGQSPLDDYDLTLPQQEHLSETQFAQSGDRSPLDDYILNLPSVDNSYYWPNRTNETTNLLTQKTLFADEDGVLPGPDQLSYMLQSRKDKDIERLLSENKSIKLREERNQYIRSLVQASGGSIPQVFIDTISGMSTDKFNEYLKNPKVVLEKEYANAVLNKSIFSKTMDETTPFGVTNLKTNGLGLADSIDKGSEVLAKREVIDNILKDYYDRYEEKSFLGKTGTVVGSIAKSIVPFMNQAREGSAVSNTVGLNRTSWDSARYQAMVRLSLLPLDQYKEALLKMVGEIDSGPLGNTMDTVEFIQALRDHTYSDSFWDNMWFGIDVASIVPIGTIARGSKAITKTVGTTTVTGSQEVVDKVFSKLNNPKALDVVIDEITVANKKVTVVTPASKGLVPIDRFPKASLVDDSDFIIKPETKELVPLANPNAIKLDRSSSERFIIPGRRPRQPGRDRRPKLGPETGDEQIIAGSKVVSDIQLDQIKTVWADSVQEAIEALTKAGLRPGMPKELAETEKAVKGIVDAHVSIDPNPARVLTAAGNTNAAAKANVVAAANAIQNVQQGIPNSPQTVLRTNWLPGYLTPNLANFQNGSVLSANASNTLWNTINTSLVAAARGAIGDNLLKVNRLTPEALTKAFAEADQYLAKRLAFANHSLLNLRSVHVDPVTTKNNVGYIEWTMGRPDGSLFPSARVANHYARIWYNQGGQRLRATDVGSHNIGLSQKEFRVEQEGNGWVIKVQRTLDESSPTVRDALVNMDNIAPKGWMNNKLGRFIFGDRNFTSNFQNLNRRTASSRTGEVRHLAKELIEKPFRALQPSERKDLVRFMDKFIAYQDPNNPQVIGKYFTNTFDLEQEYRNTFNRLPSDREINAYFSWKAANDFDHFLRNDNIFKERSIKGLENFTLKLEREIDDPARGRVVATVNSELIAKTVDDIPYKSKDDAVIAVIGPRTTGQITPVEFYRMHDMTPTQRAAIKDLVDVDKYSILHVENAADQGIIKLFGDDIHQPNFIVVKGWERAPLKYNQLPYNPGGHQVYQPTFFVKEPKMVDVNGVWEYRGDITVLGQNTQAEAIKYAKLFNEAKALLKAGNNARLSAFLADNLPYTRQEFAGLFKQTNPNGGVLDLDTFTSYTSSGSYISDLHNKELRRMYPEMRDTIRNEHNLMNELDKKFLGQRDPILHSIKEKGTPGNPLFSLEQAAYVDPLHVASDAAANSARNMFFGDYKISAVNSWIAENKHLLNNTGEEMRGNPLKAVYEPSYRDSIVNRDELVRAENSRKAIVNLLGTPSETSREMENLNMKIMNLIYKNLGQKSSDFVAEAEIPFIKNPVSFARQMVFHKTMGLFNWTQFFAQAATYANIVAISPKQGLKAGWALAPLHLALHSENPANLGRVLGAARSLGWSRQGLVEVYTELKNSGWFRIEGDHTYMDSIKGAGRIETGVGRVLDTGLMFFRSGERLSRIAAFTTAMLEHRALNPTAALTNLDRQRILDRASKLTANMTRDANSVWQTGFTSLGSQFMSYPVRMAELMLGKELTKAERFRVGMVNSILFGVPSAATLVLPLPLHDFIKEKLYNNGVDMDANVITHALFEGIPAAASKYFLGKDYNFGRYGPGGIKLFEDLFIKQDVELLQIMLGMTYGETRKLWQSLNPVFLHLADAIQTGSNPFVSTAFTPQEYLDVARNISTVNNIAKAYIAMKFGEFISKGEVKLDKADSYDAFISLAFGVNPRELDNTQILMDSIKNKKEVVQEMSKEAIKYLRRTVYDLSEGNQESAKTNHRRASIIMYLANMNVEEQSNVMTQAMKGYELMADKIPFQFVQSGGRQTSKRMEMLYGR